MPCPVVLGLSLCDYVIVEERTRKVSLIGSFSGIAASRFPAVAQPFSVFAVLTDGLGDATIQLSILRLETDEEIFVYRAQLRFPNKLTEVSFHARLRECRFPGPGQYLFTLLVDGEWVSQRRIQVYLKGEHP